MALTTDEQSEEAMAARSMAEVLRWAEVEPDGDDWEGFYLSLDLLNEVVEDETGAG